MQPETESTFKFKNADGDDTSANQAYKAYLSTTADVPKKTFKEWIEWKKTATENAHTNQGPNPPAPLKDTKPEAKYFLGMPKPVAIGVGIGLGIAAIVGLYLLIDHLTTPKEAGAAGSK